ncbi:MAG: hypothetical protein KBD06_00125 [Candidatus Pacebacteria bacterium]|nr:hypothetical protein [Candidatus Paceibacterota bacterium]
MISMKVTENSTPEDVLNLPKGRLMVGELVADFSPENVVDAARSVIASCAHDFEEHSFVTQAGIIAHVANKGLWNSNPEYKAI